MPRNVWVKLWCDILRHPFLRSRPDCDVRLVVGLLAYAKEYTADGVLRGLDAEGMRGLFGIKAPIARVEEGLEYLLRCGWLQNADDRGGLVIKDFAERQGVDSPKVRMARWREGKSESRRVDESETKPLRGSRRDVRPDAVTEALLEPNRASPDVYTADSPSDDRRAVGGESEGRKFTAPESVDNPQVDYANLSESERSHFLRLWKEGKGSEATKYLASLKQPQVPEKIQKKRGAL